MLVLRARRAVRCFWDSARRGREVWKLAKEEAAGSDEVEVLERAVAGGRSQIPKRNDDRLLHTE